MTVPVNAFVDSSADDLTLLTVETLKKKNKKLKINLTLNPTQSPAETARLSRQSDSFIANENKTTAILFTSEWFQANICWFLSFKMPEFASLLCHFWSLCKVLAFFLDMLSVKKKESKELSGNDLQLNTK